MLVVCLLIFPLMWSVISYEVGCVPTYGVSDLASKIRCNFSIFGCPNFAVFC